MVQITWGEMQPEWKCTLILVLLCTSSNTAREFCQEQINHGSNSIYACWFLRSAWRYTNQASANSSNKIKILEEEVTINDSEQSLQTISLILSSEGTDTQCINQKAHLMSEQNQLSPDWVAGLEGGTIICQDVTIRLSTSLPILEGVWTWHVSNVRMASLSAQLIVHSRGAARGVAETEWV